MYTSVLCTHIHVHTHTRRSVNRLTNWYIRVKRREDVSVGMCECVCVRARDKHIKMCRHTCEAWWVCVGVCVCERDKHIKMCRHTCEACWRHYCRDVYVCVCVRESDILVQHLEDIRGGVASSLYMHNRYTMYVYSNICIYTSVFYIHILIKHLEDIRGGGRLLLVDTQCMYIVIYVCIQVYFIYTYLLSILRTLAGEVASSLVPILITLIGLPCSVVRVCVCVCVCV